MYLIDGPHPHMRRIVASAQRRRDAGHHGRRNTSDVTFRRPMNMAAENGNHPPGMLQSLAQPRHRFQCFEMKPVRPNGHFERRMVRENRNWLFALGIDQVEQMSDLFRGKVALVALRADVSSAISRTG